MINPSYHEQNGCWNCKYVFVKKDYDEGPSYFCTLNAPERPDCGSVGMDESFGDVTLSEADQYGENMRKWDKWKEGRRVKPFGVCDHWGSEHGS